MASRNVERLLNVIMTIGSRPRRGIDRATLFEAIPEYAAAATQDAAEKMFERDKTAIRELGLPLRTERHDLWDENIVHYRLDTDAGGDDLHLSEGEYTVLLAASRAWDDAAAGGAARRVRSKLLSQGLDADTDLLRRTPRGSVESLPVLTPLLEAVSTGSRVSFAYRSARGERTDRTVEPWVVGVHEGHWYVLGHDLAREGTRVFKASRIESFPRIGGPISHPREEGMTLETALAGMTAHEDRARARLRIEPYKALALRDAAGASLRAREVELPAMPRSAALRQVRANARWITLVDPPAWRDALASAYAEIARLHTGQADLARIEDAPVRRPAAIRRSTSGADHLSRLVSLASYVLSRGEVEVSQLAEDFGISQKELIADLQILFVCGDFATGWEQDLIEVTWEDGFVRVRNADALRRALSLTAAEATALLAGLAALEPVAGEEAELVASARAKLLARLGTAAPGEDEAEPPTDAAASPVTDPAADGASDGAPKVELSRSEQILDALHRAIREDRPVVIRYSPPDRSGTSVRSVAPRQVESSAGRSYLRADCALAQDERLFRLDRIAEILPEGTPQHRDDGAAADADPGPGSRPGSEARGSGGRLEEDAWVRLEGPAMWIAEAFAAAELRDAPGGGTLARLATPVLGALVDAVMEAAGAAEVLAPASLRDLIVTTAEQAGARHTGVEAIG
ncbi:transcriptional regulator [Brachybacterium phenoliresistens]|uniref:Transcriptional regulator n=1 Tax=Brachybacterium phenoliresistens TaxID=396014 RepID=Z9JY36_9MICO|nr:WYL domain-containing protein [Brachybacterium phenoliresistens]EWS82707.1 transcriptional regulator [Brachybacterium phenoliresistens]